jgi:hypothetical protein
MNTSDAMNISDWVYPFPGRGQSLRRVIEAADGAAVTRAALDALDVLRPALEPLSAEAVIFALDGHDPLTASVVDVARPHRLLVRTPVPAGVRISAAMIDPVTTEVPDLSRAAIEGWLEDALHDAAPPGGHGEWDELNFNASRAWVGPVDWRSGEAELRLQQEGRTVVVPIERAPSGAWLSGPREPAFDQPPLDVRLTHRMGLVTLRLTGHYGYWIEPSEPAAQRLDEIIDRLRSTGWTD